MPPVDINYAAVLVTVIVNMFLGALWYSPALFGTKWMKLMGKTDHDLEKMKKDMSKAYLLAFIGTVLMSYVLAHFVDFTAATTALDGALTGFWIWLGFVFPTHLSQVIWGGKNKELFAIDMGYQLVGLLVMGAMLALWV